MYRLTELSLRWPWLTISLAIATSALGGWLASRVPATSGAHALIGSSHPEVLRLEAFLEEFGGGYPAIVAWSCEAPSDPCRSALDEPSLAMAYHVGLSLSQSPHVSRVASPAHSALPMPVADGIAVHRFVVDGRVETSPEAVAAAISDPLWQRTLISQDARVGALVVESANTSPADQVALVSAIEAAIEPYQRAGFRFYLSGNPLFHVASQREAVAETALIGASTGLVISVCFLLLIRCWQAVAGVMTTVALATGCGLGLIPILGWSWDPLTSAAPTLILVMGSADAIHYLTSYLRERSRQLSRNDALIRAARETIAPCTMTTATSAAGLASFIGTESVGFAHFGAVTAAGVGACLLFTFTVLPALLSRLPDPGAFALRESERWEAIAARLIEFPIQNWRWILLTSVAAALIGAVGLSRLTTDAHPLSYWRQGHPTREAFEFVANRLTSIEGVELRLALPSPLEDGAAVDRVSKLESDLRQVPGVRSVRSLLTVLEQAAHALGLARLDAANTGEVLALASLGGAAALDHWVSVDHRTVRISMAADLLGVASREELLQRTGDLIHALPPAWEASMTGPSVLQRSIDQVVRDSALQAFSGTSLIVSLLIMAFLGSVRWGALGMIPNLLPMIVLFGLMGFLGVALDAGSALVAPIAIGIAVDDTIHFLHAFKARRRLGHGSIDAARLAGRHVGRAIVTTSATLAAGFLAMLVSRFQSMANIGLLSAAAIAAAFAAELLVLPALISLASEGGGPPRPVEENEGA